MGLVLSSKKSLLAGTAMFSAVAALIGIYQAIYVLENRAFPFFDIDESGYLQKSVQLGLDLRTLNIVQWIKDYFIGQSFAPLVPAISSAIVIFSNVPQHVVVVNAVFLSGTAVLQFLWLKDLRGRAAGWLGGLAVLATPALIDFSRIYNFAISTTFFLTLAMLLLSKSRAFKNLRFSIFAGIALGFFLLSRTMTLGIIPGIIGATFLVAYKAVGASDNTKSNFKKFVLAIAVVSGPWYLLNSYNVFGYLFSFGYGKQSQEYGFRKPIYDIQAWLDFVRDFINTNTFAPLASTVTLWLAFVLVAFFRNKRIYVTMKFSNWRRTLSHDLFICWSLLVWSVIALISTKNMGSGFTLILLPLLFTLAFSLQPKKYLKLAQILTTACLVVVLAMNHSSKLTLNPNSRLEQIGIPLLGDMTLTDGRSAYQRYFTAAYSNIPYGTSSAGSQTEWAVVAEETLDSIRTLGSSCTTLFGFRHSVLNVNALELLSSIKYHENFKALMINPQLEGQTLEEQIQNLGAKWKGTCVAISATGESGEFNPKPNRVNFEAALQSLGFRLNRTTGLPDGRLLKIWTIDGKIDQ